MVEHCSHKIVSRERNLFDDSDWRQAGVGSSILPKAIGELNGVQLCSISQDFNSSELNGLENINFLRVEITNKVLVKNIKRIYNLLITKTSWKHVRKTTRAGIEKIQKN